MFLKKSSRLRCFRFFDLLIFVGFCLRVLEVPFFPLPICFLAVLFAAFLRDVFPAIASPSSGTADSITSFPSLLATGMTYLRKI